MQREKFIYNAYFDTKGKRFLDNEVAINSPCKNCKERFVGCHSNCEKYNQFRKDLEEYKAKKVDKKRGY